MVRLEALCTELLKILADGEARAPATLAERMGLPVAEIDAALATLRDAGLALLERGGGRLAVARPFAPLDRDAIARFAEDLHCKAEIVVRPTVDSTNTELLKRARGSGARLPADQMTVLVAELQYAGRGRLGRSWSAQAGASLTVSYARRLPTSVGGLAGLSLMCGLAVRDALERSGVSLELKWPNDLLWRRHKLGGILIEVHPLGPAESCVVIGVGLNVDLAGSGDLLIGRIVAGGLPPTDLVSAGAAAPVDRNRLVADVLDTLEARLAQFREGGFAPYCDDWNAHHAYRDEAVEMFERGEVVHVGIARGVDHLGRLRLETAAGPRLVVAGDISLRLR